MGDSLDTEIFQRLVLANQYEILACLDPDGEEGYRDLARQIQSGWPLERLQPAIWLEEACEDPLTAGDQDFVRDMLELFDALQRADERSGGTERGAVAFPGFCGNYEGKYLAFFDWLRRQRHYTYVRLANPRETNSHMPMLPAYERMLARWEALGRPRELEAADAAAILAERRSKRLAAADR